MPNRWLTAARTGGEVLPDDRNDFKEKTTVSHERVRRSAMWLMATLLFGLLQPVPVQAALIYNGSTGGISFGVTNYNGGPQVTPEWIANNFTGRIDILASPGGSFQRAYPVLANNIASTGNVAFGSLSAFQVGGGNGNGPFGTGSGFISGPGAYFAVVGCDPGRWRLGVLRYREAGILVTPRWAITSGRSGPTSRSAGSSRWSTRPPSPACRAEVTFGVGRGAVTYILAPIVLAMDRTANGFSYVAIGGTGACWRWRHSLRLQFGRFRHVRRGQLRR